jgi:deoxycytidine triphosphate deaminase
MSGAIPRQTSPGGLLAASEIRARLHDGKIFRENTWADDQVRGASYDVRIATDLMFVPDGKGGHTKVALGGTRKDPIVLAAGEVALVSTAERCCFPIDLGTHVSVKWDLARRGLLVLTGGFVNPGFGFRRDGEVWVPEDDERLHFLVVNVGSQPQALTPLETAIASLQFETLVGDPGVQPAGSTHVLIANTYKADTPSEFLALFPELARQRDTIDELARDVSRLEHGFQPVIMFGVYLFLVTLLGVVLSFSLQWINDSRVERFTDSLPTNWLFIVLAVVAIAASALVALRLIEFVGDIVTKWISRPRQ